MPTTDTPKAQEVSFKGGLNLGADYLNLPAGQCTTLSDWVLEYGCLQGRQPYRILNNAKISTDAISSVWSFSDSNGTFIYASTGHAGAGKIWRTSSLWQETMLLSPTTFSDVTGTLAPQTAAIQTARLNSKLIVVSDAMATAGKFDSNTAVGAALGGSPPSIIVDVHVVNNYLFAITNLTSTLYWSAPGDPETWPASNFITVNGTDGDYCTALGSVGTDVMIFKSASTARLSTNSQVIAGATTLGPLTTLFYNIGCHAPGVTDNIGDGRCVFMARDGDVYITDGYVLQSLAGLAPPNPRFRETFFRLINLQHDAFLCYYEKRNEVWFMSFSFGNSQVFIYDLTQNYWRTITGLGNGVIGVLKVNFPFSGATYPSFMLGAVSTNGSGTGLSNILCLDDYLNSSSGTPILGVDGSTVTAIAQTSIFLPTNLAGADPFGISVFYQPSSATRATLNIGYDNTFSGTTYTFSGANKIRWDFTNLGFATVNNQRPSTAQLKLQTTQIGDRIPWVYAYPELGA